MKCISLHKRQRCISSSSHQALIDEILEVNHCEWKEISHQLRYVRKLLGYRCEWRVFVMIAVIV